MIGSKTKQISYFVVFYLKISILTKKKKKYEDVKSLRDDAGGDV
jgi:hypothetical protein